MDTRSSDWDSKIKQVDPNFEGSIHQKLGLSDILCSTCGAHCKVSNGELICLNACHLVSEAQETFHKLWILLNRGNIEDIIGKAVASKDKGKE